PPRPEGLPEGLAALLRQACRELSDGKSLDGSLFIHVTHGSFRFDVLGMESTLEAIPVSPENREPPPDRGLLELLRPLQEDDAGHLVTADWLEDWMGPNPASSALRASERGRAVSPAEAERMLFHSFGWRWLDRDVIIYLAGALHRGLLGIARDGFLV